jgi:hypothetical protein
MATAAVGDAERQAFGRRHPPQTEDSAVLLGLSSSARELLRRPRDCDDLRIGGPNLRDMSDLRVAQSVRPVRDLEVKVKDFAVRSRRPASGIRQASGRIRDLVEVPSVSVEPGIRSAVTVSFTEPTVMTSPWPIALDPSTR